MEIKESILTKLQTAFPSTEIISCEYKGELSLTFPKENILEICRYLKEDNELSFNYCEDVTAVDWSTRKNRFTLIYHLFSMKNEFRLRLKCNVDEKDPIIDSVSSVWQTANWEEREVYDMFGLQFKNHPDLRRMYLPEEFEYHPLRKEFPLMGIPGSFHLPKK